MKKLQLLAIAICTTAAVYAQDLRIEEVPNNLKEKFNKEYAQATDVEWEMDGENYKVEFDLGRMDNKVWYSKSGKVIRMEKELSEKELPLAIASSIKSKYAGYKIDDIKMTKAVSELTYKVELKKGLFEERKVVFDESGNVISDMLD